MKFLFKIIFLLIINVLCFAQDATDYQAIIQPCATAWNNEYISQLSTQEIITITDMILLSYQVVQSSVIMSQARLIIQSELLNIVTLSINDTFDARMQAQNNDLTVIKKAITDIEQAQENIKFACNTLKKFGPLIININPTVIQSFIFNLKSVILSWAKTQQKTVTDLKLIKLEFIKTPHLLSNISNIFETIASTTNPIDHILLLYGANSLTDMYKNIETMLADLTIVRQESITNFNIILTLFFKYHYQVLHDHLENMTDSDFKLLATPDHKLPQPEQIFALA